MFGSSLRFGPLDLTPTKHVVLMWVAALFLLVFVLIAVRGLFGIVTTMPFLYAVRAAGGLLSAALFPSASAYVADLTAQPDRQRGMAVRAR